MPYVTAAARAVFEEMALTDDFSTSGSTHYPLGCSPRPGAAHPCTHHSMRAVQASGASRFILACILNFSVPVLDLAEAVTLEHGWVQNSI